MSKILVITDRLDNQRNLTNGVKAAKAIGQLGHNVIIAGHEVLTVDAIRKANLILAFGTLLYPTNIHQASEIAEYKRPETPFALWYFDACNPKFRHSYKKYRAMLQIVSHLDWLFTTDHSYPWENHVKNYRHLMQGIDPDDFKGVIASPEPRQFDVIFTGGFGGRFDERKRQLNIIAKHFTVDIYGRHSSRRVYGGQFWLAHQKARVVYVPAPPSEIANHYWSNRIYLAMATGTPCVVGYVPGIERHFNQSEVLFFKTDFELLGCIDKLVKDPDLRARMGAEARKRTLTEHTYQARVKWLLHAIGVM
jgi:hypothetical protein